MKVKWGAIVVEGRGKLGGHIASRNGSGSYFKSKVSPINPNTSFQSLSRVRFTTLAQLWRSLTDEQRTSWISVVGEYAATDVFGDSHTPSGFNLFQRLNNNLDIVGVSPILIGPFPITVPDQVLNSFSIDIGAGDSATVTPSGAVPPMSSMEIWLTGSLSPGRSFVKSEYRLLQVAAAGTGPAVQIKDAMNARFGIPSAGSLVFCQIRYISTITGQATLLQTLSTIVLDT